MTKIGKPVGSEHETTEVRILKHDELDIVSAGGMLSSVVSQTIKSFGQALQTAARAG